MATEIENTGSTASVEDEFEVDELVRTLQKAWALIEASEPDKAKRKELWEAFQAKLVKSLKP